MDYSHLANTSKKISFLKSMNLLPKQIFEICNLVNAMRNDFAHNLKINSFDKVKGLMGTLRDYFKYFYPDAKDNYNDYDFFRGFIVQIDTAMAEFNLTLHQYGNKIREYSILDDIT